MSEMIQVTPEELRAKGAFFCEKSGEVDSVLGQLDRAKAEIMEIWKGSSSNSFIRQYDELQPTMKKFVTLANDIGEQIKSIAQTLEETDREIASRIGY